MPESEKKRTPTISDDLRIIFIQTYIPEADSDILRIIFIQTIATCQKVKKADLRCFDNLIHNAKCQKVKKADSDILTILE